MKVREKKRLCRLKSVEKLPGFEPITIFMQSVNYQYTVTCRNCVCGIAVVKDTTKDTIQYNTTIQYKKLFSPSEVQNLPHSIGLQY